MIKRNATLAYTLFPVLAYIQIYRSSARFMPDRVKRGTFRLRATNFPLERVLYFPYFLTFQTDEKEKTRRLNVAARNKATFMQLSLSFRFSRSFAAKTRFLSVETVILINRALWLANPLKFLISHQRWIIIIFSFFFSFLRARGCIPRQHARLLLALTLI